MLGMIWPGVFSSDSAGLLECCGVPVKDSRPCLKSSGRPQLVPGFPLNATLSGPRTDQQTGQRQRLKTRLGQALKNVLAARPTRKSISRLQPAALPRTRPSRGCCDSKTQCHGNGCATPGAGCLESRTGPFGWVLRYVCTHHPLVILLCLAWACVGLRSAAFAGRPASSLPLFMPRGQHSWHTCLLFWLLPSSSLFLLKTVPPWAQLVESVRWSGPPA